MRRKNTTASITVTLRKNRKNKFGAYPVIIRISKDNEVAIRSVGYDCLESEWDGDMQRPNTDHPKYLEVKRTIDKIISRIEDKELEFRGKNEFYSVYDLTGLVSKETGDELLFDCFDKVIIQMEKDGMVGNADNYANTKRIVELFAKNPKLKFHQVNYTFLNSMLSFFRGRGNKDTTMFFYFKTFRAFLNRCIRLGYCEQSDYGFKTFSLSQFNLTTRKRALPLDGIRKLASIELKSYSAQWNARNYFLFSFYTRGTNLVDIAKLRRKSIVDGRLEYYRIKTGDFISVQLNDKALEIIEVYKDISYGDFLFPIFDEKQKNDSKKPERLTREQKDKLGSFTRSISRRFALIANKCGIGGTLTFYVGRHSYANGMRRSGAGTSIIKEALSQKDEKTTAIYLNDFGNYEIDEYENILYTSIKPPSQIDSVS